MGRRKRRKAQCKCAVRDVTGVAVRDVTDVAVRDVTGVAVRDMTPGLSLEPGA